MIGDFTIYNKAEKQHKDFVERTLTLKTRQGFRQIVQLHYTEWPRQGVPSDLSSLSDMLEILQAKRRFPILVHCR
jgi:protein tyrosine phosphatase